MKNKIPVVMSHVNLRLCPIPRNRLRNVTLYVLFVHRLRLQLFISSLNEGLYLVHWTQISGVSSDYNVASAVHLLVIHDSLLSLFFFHLGLLCLNVLFNLFTDAIIWILLEIHEDVRSIGFDFI